METAYWSVQGRQSHGMVSLACSENSRFSKAGCIGMLDRSAGTRGLDCNDVGSAAEALSKHAHRPLA